MDAEEVMGMFSALKKRAPNATLAFLSARMRAKKIHIIEYLDELHSERREKGSFLMLESEETLLKCKMYR